MKKVILLIEDNTDIRESTAELLALDGYEVIEAPSGEFALSILEMNKPDVIICDIVLTGIDGYEIFERLKQNKKQIPFIFSTAKTENRDRLKAEKIGVSHYLAKPFNETELLKSIDECLSCQTG